MNYTGNEELRADVAALAAAFFELRQQMRGLEARYFYGCSDLPARLAGQIISQMNEQLLVLYKQANEMEHAFKD